jgi:hypothetical protein
MKRVKYSIRTEGNRTIVRLSRRDRMKFPQSGSTSAPPWDEIKHLFEGQPAPRPKRRTKKKR